MTATLRNWAGNIAYAARAVHTPSSVAELQAIVRGSDKLRALGSRHSFNRIADTDGDLVSMRRLNRIVRLDATARTVTVEGGITYGELGPALHAQGFAIHNLASLPHIGVVGAVSTATHGSGNANRNLAGAVAGLEIVTATGDIVSLKRGDADFDGAVVGLGALGVVSAITLDIEPTFEVRQDVFLDLPFAALTASFEAISSSAYSVSFFTSWRGDIVDMVWLKNRAGAPPPPRELFGARAADRPIHPIAAIDPTPCTEQLGVLGPWHERLPHFRMEFTPSAGAELQSEYFVARADAAAAFTAIRGIEDQIAPLLLISEIRTQAADDLWLSMNHERDSVSIHFTWKPDWEAVRRVLPAIEAALAPFGARPHWGKLFALPGADIQQRYSRLGDFRALARRYDPTGKFTNELVAACVF
jgi:xylitol oxidase